MANIYEILRQVQAEINVKKTHENKFAGFMYRNAEDIFSAIKPLSEKYGFTIVIRDSICEMSNRLFLKSTASFCIDDENAICSDGYAEIGSPQNGMNLSQATGSASSYARKYALSALLLLDDGADADMEPLSQKTVGKMIADSLHDRCKGDDKLEAFLLKAMGIKKWDELINGHYHVLDKKWDLYVKKFKEENEG